MEFGVAHLTALELSPTQLVVQASQVGFRSVGLRMHSATPGGIAYPSVIGTQAHHALRNLLKSEGVSLNEIEFFPLTPGVNVAGFAGMLEAAADLGASSLTVSGDDPDQSRLVANFAALCDLAASLGLRVEIEFMRWRVTGTLDKALAIVVAANRPNGAVLLDALHLIRSGGAVADLRRVPSQFVRSAQISDGHADAPVSDAEIIAEAREGRLPPGEGALPLLELLDALQPDTALSVETPMIGTPADARLRLAHDSTRRLLQLRQPNPKISSQAPETPA